MEENTDFSGRDGSAVSYSPDGVHLYLWNGTPAGYVANDRVYGFNGRLLGWFVNGWLYDRHNKPALFSRAATGGPVKPARSVRPVKSVRSVRPVKSVKQSPHARPARSLSWSNVADERYFEQ